MKYQVTFEDVDVGDPWPSWVDAHDYIEGEVMSGCEAEGWDIVPVIEATSSDYQLASTLSH